MVEKYDKTRTVPFQESTGEGLEVKILVLSLLLVRVPRTFIKYTIKASKHSSSYVCDIGTELISVRYLTQSSFMLALSAHSHNSGGNGYSLHPLELNSTEFQCTEFRSDATDFRRIMVDGAQSSFRRTSPHNSVRRTALDQLVNRLFSECPPDLSIAMMVY